MTPHCRKSAGTNHLEQKFRITLSMSEPSEKFLKRIYTCKFVVHCLEGYPFVLELGGYIALISLMVNKKNVKCYICIAKINEDH